LALVVQGSVSFVPCDAVLREPRTCPFNLTLSIVDHPSLDNVGKDASKVAIRSILGRGCCRDGLLGSLAFHRHGSVHEDNGTMLCQECADDFVSHFRHGSDNESSSCHWLDRLYCDSHDSVCREWWYLVSRRRARGSIQCRRVLENWHGDESNGCFGTSWCVDCFSCEPVVCVAAKDEAWTDGIAHHSPQLSPTTHTVVRSAVAQERANQRLECT
jgi:hypothetical protein